MHPELNGSGNICLPPSRQAEFGTVRSGSSARISGETCAMKTRTKGSKSFEVATIVYFLLISPFVGCVAGGLLVSFWQSPAAVRWESLGAPPEKPVKIVFAHMDSVYVQSATGQTYSCEIEPNRSCWNETQTDISALSSWTCRGETPIPPPSDKIISRAEACQYLVEIGQRRVVYALTGDGQIWMWRYAPQSWSIIPGIEGVLPGAVVGLLIGIILAIIISQTG